jgi:Zn-finger nucleic acid-binding protein
MQEQERERLKQLHWMHCPKCGFELTPVAFKGVTIDRCFHCGGTWLDAGELEALAGKESEFLHRVIALFKH